jgi:Putative polyhydroxyalkanoic acid system protein (PHA_gran_rgn)
MPQIKREYPGKKADEIYEKVDQVMERLTVKMGLKYHKDPVKKTGKVSKLGIAGTYLASDGQVVIDLNFPMIIPGSMKKQVQEDIERRLDGLFA